MRIVVDRVGVDGAHGPLLTPTSMVATTGQITLVSGEPGTGHTALALAIAGRMRHDHGQVLLNGRPDPAGLRRAVAVVDSADTTEPEDNLTLAVAVGEELSLAGTRANRAAVRRWLAAHDAEALAGTRMDQVPAATRTRLLAELAAARPGVGALVFDRPERHTAQANTWWSVALAHAGRGLAVVVLGTDAATTGLGVPPARIGTHEQPTPFTVLAPTQTSEIFA